MMGWLHRLQGTTDSGSMSPGIKFRVPQPPQATIFNGFFSVFTIIASYRFAFQ
jgi:hypothetical protein